MASVVAVSPPRRTLAREHSAADIASDEHDVVRVSPTKNKSDTYRSALGLYTETRAATVSTLPPSPDAEYVDSSTLLATRLWKDGTMTTCSLQAGAKGFATYDFGDGVKESEVPNLVVTARDTEVRRRPAACVVASDVDSDADVVLDAPAVSEVPDVPTEPTAIDVVDKTVLQLCSRQEQQRLELKKYTWMWYKNHHKCCGATVVWRQAASASGSAGSHPSVFSRNKQSEPSHG